MDPRDLPKLPGLVYNQPGAPGQRKQTLKYVNGYAVPCDLPSNAPAGGYAAPPAGAQQQYQQAPEAAPSAAPRAPPGWLVDDKKVLRFYAYFEEAVPNSRAETSRVRKMDILFYIMDGTTEVTEPRVANSGLPQGAFLKRVRVPKGPAGPPGAPPPAFIGADDFFVGGDVTLFGRTFSVCGCDPFTRSYYEERGFDQSPDMPLPESALDAARARASAAAARTHTASAVQKGKQFLQNDGKVLCFPGLLIDPSAEQGSRPIIFNYYLGDSTGEVKEPGVGLLLHRQRLPVAMPSSGVAALGGGDPNAAYVRAESLRVGDRLRVYAREFQLLDADPFTRAWFRDTLRIEQPPALAGPAPPAARAKPALPPHNGYGTPADSARSCLSLVPKAFNTDKNHAQYMAYSGMVLRFNASMDAMDPSVRPLDASDVGRQFVVNFFLEDNTLSVFEPAVTGRPASRYLERVAVCTPGTEVSLKPGALTIGAELIIFSRRFTLTGCDGFTETFMCEHPQMWA